jgi:hypothetical protein
MLHAIAQVFRFAQDDNTFAIGIVAYYAIQPPPTTTSLS